LRSGELFAASGTLGDLTWLEDFLHDLEMSCRAPLLRWRRCPPLRRRLSNRAIYLFICLQWQAQGPWTHKTHTNTKTKKRLKQTTSPIFKNWRFKKQVRRQNSIDKRIVTNLQWSP